jgi:predicted phage tail protein
VVTGLTNGKVHIFVVRAVNAQGPGAWVELPRVVTPALPPGAVTGLAATPGDGQVTLSWTAPASTGGSPITNYEIQVAEQTSGVWSGYRPVSRSASAATSAVVTGLTNGKVHIFVVRAQTEAGYGPWVELTPVVTPSATIAKTLAAAAATVPGLVSGLTATAGSRQVTLSWTAPADDGGSPITDYEIQVAEQTAGVWSSYRPVVRPASTATTATITGLTAGKIHIFVVRAVNARGPGQWVELPRLVTPLA